MRNRQLPSVELVQEPPYNASQTSAHWRRWKVFFGVLLLAAAIGLAIVYSRSPVYRASASVLTVQPSSIDRHSIDADVQHNAIQGRLLLGEDLLGRLSQQSQTNTERLSVAELQQMLSVHGVPDTNLLELRAEGSAPEQLRDLVNAWAENYQVFRAEEIESLAGRTLAQIRDEAATLDERISRAREELRAFRRDNRIVGLERGENTALAAHAGIMPPDIVDALRREAPPGAERAPTEIDFTYPALAY